MCERYICGMGFTSEEKPIRIIHDKVEDKDYYLFADLCKIMNEQQNIINKQEEIIKSQDMEISRQYNLCLAMSGVLREEFGVYDVFDRTEDRKIERDDMNDF